MRHFLSAADLTRDAALGLFALAADVKQRRKAGQTKSRRGAKRSTRSRSSGHRASSRRSR
jgi:ornithine carbamoyltransferase